MKDPYNLCPVPLDTRRFPIDVNARDDTGRAAAPRRRLPFVILAALLASPSAAHADDGWIDEGKLGLNAHDIPLGGDHVEPGVDVNGELLFVSPGLLSVIGSPRPHLGGSVNTSGATSYAYTGLTWTFSLPGPLFFGVGLGGAVHDGDLNEIIPDRKELGSRVLFHEYVELGSRFADSLSGALSLSLFVDHMSDANLTRHNAGMTNFGLRTGYKF
jgi:lipid A 3-O-deacylase